MSSIFKPARREFATASYLDKLVTVAAFYREYCLWSLT